MIVIGFTFSGKALALKLISTNMYESTTQAFTVLSLSAFYFSSFAPNAVRSYLLNKKTKTLCLSLRVNALPGQDRVFRDSELPSQPARYMIFETNRIQRRLSPFNHFTHLRWMDR